MNCSMPGFPDLHYLPEFACSYPLSWWCHPAISSSVTWLPSIFPRIRVFSNESALCIRWPKFWNSNFNISPSNDLLLGELILLFSSLWRFAESKHDLRIRRRGSTRGRQTSRAIEHHMALCLFKMYRNPKCTVCLVDLCWMLSGGVV